MPAGVGCRGSPGAHTCWYTVCISHMDGLDPHGVTQRPVRISEVFVSFGGQTLVNYLNVTTGFYPVINHFV